MNTTLATTTSDSNGTLADDWEYYRAYTRFYYIADEVFLYANPILILIGKSMPVVAHAGNTLYSSRHSYPCIIHDYLSSQTYVSLSRVGVHGYAIADEHSHSRRPSDDAMAQS